MLRRLFLSMLLLFVIPGLSFSATPVNMVPQSTLNPDYCAHQATGTATYLLASALTGTTSASVDVGLFGCYFLTVSQTAGAPVRLWWSDNATTYTAGTTNTAGTMWGTMVAGGPNQPAVYAVPKVARYFWVDVPPSYGVPFAAGGLTPTAIKTTVWAKFPTNWPY